jgi:hypothetical protein
LQNFEKEAKLKVWEELWSYTLTVDGRLVVARASLKPLKLSTTPHMNIDCSPIEIIGCQILLRNDHFRGIDWPEIWHLFAVWHNGHRYLNLSRDRIDTLLHLLLLR